MIDKRKVSNIILILVLVSAPITGVISMVIFPVTGNTFIGQLLERILYGMVITASIWMFTLPVSLIPLAWGTVVPHNRGGYVQWVQTDL